MYKYKIRYFEYVRFFGGSVLLEFNSQYHIALLKTKIDGKLVMVYFEDIDIAINLPFIKELEINDKKYGLNEYWSKGELNSVH